MPVFSHGATETVVALEDVVAVAYASIFVEQTITGSERLPATKGSDLMGRTRPPALLPRAPLDERNPVGCRRVALRVEPIR